MQVRPQRLLDYREFPVLYVDDEPENLRIFELGFRRDFTVHHRRERRAGARDPRAAARSRSCLSDQKMPGLTGVEFLARARELDPKTIRMLITAYGDAETLGERDQRGLRLSLHREAVAAGGAPPRGAPRDRGLRARPRARPARCASSPR